MGRNARLYWNERAEVYETRAPQESFETPMTVAT